MELLDMNFAFESNKEPEPKNEPQQITIVEAHANTIKEPNHHDAITTTKLISEIPIKTRINY